MVTLNEPMAKLTWWQFYFTYADWIDVAMMLLGTAGGMATVSGGCREWLRAYSD